MDSVRFGRALGVGARAAAKTLVTAVDAATAPNPSAGKQKPAQTSTSAQSPTATAAKPSHAPDTRTAQRPNPTPRTAQARQTGQGLARGSKLFAQAVWKPFVKLSGVLGLELAGVFFGLFAFFGAGWAWKSRAAIHETATNHDAHVQFLVCTAMAIVFGYFLVSSFVRARRRGRGQ
ncbi:MAG TPA: hypothetical protein VFE38_15535 [Edaphobacter sp.]|nr:hypothetical protein [Edaphobacter sp.]